jgi:hypothetical protein
MSVVSPESIEAHHALSAYTLTRGDASFIHQHVVDTFAVQTAGPSTKPVAVLMGLVGLFLHCERGFTGRRVQAAHVAIARKTRAWPTFDLPAVRGRVGPLDVMAAPEGDARDAAIHAWAASVWEACVGLRPAVLSFLEAHGIV